MKRARWYPFNLQMSVVVAIGILVKRTLWPFSAPSLGSLKGRILERWNLIEDRSEVLTFHRPSVGFGPRWRVANKSPRPTRQSTTEITVPSPRPHNSLLSTLLLLIKIPRRATSVLLAGVFHWHRHRSVEYRQSCIGSCVSRAWGSERYEDAAFPVAAVELWGLRTVAFDQRSPCAGRGVGGADVCPWCGGRGCRWRDWG